MNLKYYILSFILIFASVNFSYSQESKTNRETIEDIIEEIASSTDEELDYTTLFDNLNYYINNPLNLNVATKDELEKLQILNDFQMNSLISYVEKNGQLLSIYELQLVYGYSVDDIQKLMPFITVSSEVKDNTFSLKKALKYGNHQLFLRTQQVLESQTGFSEISDSLINAKPDSRYLGSPQKIYAKYKYNYKNFLAFGITAEKDAGEVFFKNNVHDSIKDEPFYDNLHNGFDYYSAHLQISNIGAVKTICLGDYQVQFGQGLVIWSGLGYGKSPYVLNVKKKNAGIKKYSSTDENKFMRGAGATFRHKNLDFTAFYSRKKVDANIAEIDTLEDMVAAVSSLQITGLHTKPSELENKHAITENVMGGNLTYNHAKFKTGLTFVNYIFGADLERNIKPYNQFEFNSSQNANIGLDYQFTLQKINFFGEAAMSQNGGMAFINGALMPLVSQVTLSVVQRSYQRNYQSYYGGAFGEASKLSNEQGFYIGAEVLPYKKWKVSAYFDRYKFPWLTSSTDAPTEGYDYLLQVDYNMSRYVSMYAKIKQEIKGKNGTSETVGVDPIVPENNIKLRYHISYQISRKLSLKNRVEYAFYGKDGERSNGYLFYQDVNYRPSKLPLTLSFRYAIFDTESYDSKIYAYETDVLYAFSVPAYYSKGTRYYLTMKYSITGRIDLWLRYARTTYDDKDVIGSSLTEIQGNHKSEVKAQLRIKF